MQRICEDGIFDFKDSKLIRGGFLWKRSSITFIISLRAMENSCKKELSQYHGKIQRGFMERIDYDFSDDANELKMPDSMKSIAFSQIMQGEADTDEIFVRTFVNEEMETDFPLIANEFLRHVGSDIKKYTDETFGIDSMDVQSPMSALQVKVMNMIFSAARDDDAYAAELIRRMYKIYYRNEYKALKRFRDISYDELCAFENEEEPREITMARILAVTRFFGIGLSLDIPIAFLKIHEYFEEDFSDDYPSDIEYFDIPKKLREQSDKEVEKYFPVDAVENKHCRKNYRKYFDLEKFTGAAFRYFGMVPYYDTECNRTKSSLHNSYTLTRSILSLVYPDRTFTEEEMRLYVLNFRTIQAFSSQIMDFDQDLDAILGREDIWRKEESRWEPVDETKIKTANVKEKPALLANVVLKKSEVSNPEALEAEIERLQSDLKVKEQKLIHTQSLYSEARRRIREIETDEEKISDEHEELVKLRNFVYGLTEEDLEISEEDQATMEQKIRGKKIIIIGGHSNWTSQLRQKFPEWKFIKPGVSAANDPHVVLDADYVYFFTDTICHSIYGTFIHIVRTKNIPFGYIHSTNIGKNIQQIYEDVV